MKKNMAKKFLACLLLAGVPTLAMTQQTVGEVEFAQGIVAVSVPGAESRFLVKGDPVFLGETVNTSERGYAVLKFADGAKMTLRPQTSFQVERFAHGGGEENALFRLLRGGVRAITGLIGKRNPKGLTVETSTATIGIRGTDFDARLCSEDCVREGRTLSLAESETAKRTTPDLVVARVVQLAGSATARSGDRPSRILTDGAPLYVSDEVRTADGATLVIAFRDQSRFSLNPGAVVRIDGFSYGHSSPDNLVVRLLKGGVRAFTGLIGKRQPEVVKVNTLVGTIGIRGTGMDMSCEGPCVDPAIGQPPAPARTPSPRAPRIDDGLFIVTWEGGNRLIGTQPPLDLDVGQSAFVGAGGVARLLSATPEFMLRFLAPRPDRVEVDWGRLFGEVAPSNEDGLYLLVRDGHVVLTTAAGSTDYGAGEAGFASSRGGLPVRLSEVPDFMRLDPYPLPTDPGLQSGVYQLYGITLGQPGQDICQLQ